MWADKVRYGFAGFRSTASPDRIAKSPVVDIAHARFRKNDCRVPQEKFRVQDSTYESYEVQHLFRDRLILANLEIAAR